MTPIFDGHNDILLYLDAKGDAVDGLPKLVAAFRKAGYDETALKKFML